jgi:hypothetical protein
VLNRAVYDGVNVEFSARRARWHLRFASVLRLDF